jgi:ribokinase
MTADQEQQLLSADRADVSVVVVGSANLDLVFSVPAIPAPGETILATDRSQHLGGKGNNQATAAARAGADTIFVGSLGQDESAESIMEGFGKAGISPQVRRQQDLPTGTALITVDDHGENAIVVDSGANARLTDLTPDELSTVAEAGILLMQLEIPLATVISAAEHAKQSETLVVLNAAPMQDLPEELLAAVDVLIVNETEAARLTDETDPDVAARRLSESVPNVIITVGADGAVIAGRDAEPHHVPGHQVEVIDTTGAGDTFCGALVADLARTARDGGAPDLIAAVAFATRAAALSVQRAGAVPSIPTRQQIDQFG